jgi:hypothetical protein
MSSFWTPVGLGYRTSSVYDAASRDAAGALLAAGHVSPLDRTRIPIGDQMPEVISVPGTRVSKALEIGGRNGSFPPLALFVDSLSVGIIIDLGSWLSGVSGSRA